MNLFIDTSNKYSGVALIDSAHTQNVDQYYFKEGESPSEKLVQRVSDMLTANSLKLKDIKTVYCTNGPGSFTGIRVGVNFTRTACHSLNISCAAVDSLKFQALSLVESSSEPIVSMIYGFRDIVYWATYDPHSLVTISSPKASTVSEIIDAPPRGHAVGNAIERFPELSTVFCSAKTLGKDENPLNSAFKLSNFPSEFPLLSDYSVLIPNYIRASEPEEKLASKQ
jgi:tRNA threonylcarbamoyl adenosine modification protein YeaZ